MLHCLETRQAHLRLSEPCKLIGGVSSNFTGLLAEKLGTSIPNRGIKPVVHLCHACGVAGCSNTNHLYWGTAKENVKDAMNHGTWHSISERMRTKYGEDEYKLILKRNATSGGRKGGGHNVLSAERIEEIKAAIESVPEGYGRVAAISRMLGVSHTSVRKYIQRWVSISGNALSS